MSVVINGTTGVSGVSGSAATPSIQGDDTNTGIFFPAADVVAVSTAGTERMRIDGSGNVLIGTTANPDSAKAHIAGGGITHSSNQFNARAGAGNQYEIVNRNGAGFDFYVNSAGTLAARIDSAGHVGIGVTPAAWGAASTAIQVGGGMALSRYGHSLNAYYDGASYRYIASGAAATLYQQQANANHAWYTAPSGTAGNAISFTQAMTLDASGSLLVGTTSNNLAAGAFYLVPGTNAELGIGHASAATSGSTFVAFRYNNTNIGSITQNGTTAVAYNTSSDYRLKENIQPMTGALEKIAQLNPVTYTWKVDGSAGQGFIAHELQAVVPDCVTGERDAVDADGNPQYQGVDTSFLVATLVRAVQEQQAIIASLEARLDAAGL